MKLWFRVDAATPRDPTVAEFAARLNVSVVTALGHCVAIWSAMAEHATDGSLERVSDATIEAWAMWTKRKGVLAQAFRALFTDDANVVHGWLDRQGKLLTRMERDRQRHRKPEESSTEIPRSFPGNSTSTERNGTEQRSTPPPPPRRARDASPKYLEVRAQLPAEFHADFDRLLDLVPEASTWCAAIAARLPTGAMHGKPHDPAHVGEGIRQFLMAGRAGDAKPIQFWRYVETAAEPPPPVGAAANGSGRPGGAARNQAAPAKSYDYANPTNSEDEIKWQD